MKILLTIFALVGFSAIAQAEDVKITSFYYQGPANANPHLADLCATVLANVAAPTFVQITVDPGKQTESHYNTFAGSDKKFCIVVTTYFGVADAQLLK